MQFIGKIFTLMVEWLKYYLKTESKPIPLEVSENLPRKSMRILINPEFIHGKRQQRAEFIYENFWCKNVSCWFFTNSFIQIEGLRLWEAAWRTDCLKKRKEKNCNKTSPPNWPSLLALSYVYPWEYAEAAEIIFTGWRWPYHSLWRWQIVKASG